MVAIKEAMMFLYRVIIVFIGVSSILSVIWYLEDMGKYKLIATLMAAISEIVVGIVPISIAIKKMGRVHILLCIAGVISSTFLAAYHIFVYREPDWVVVVIYFIVIIFFGQMLKKQIEARKHIAQSY